MMKKEVTTKKKKKVLPVEDEKILPVITQFKNEQLGPYILKNEALTFIKKAKPEVMLEHMIQMFNTIHSAAEEIKLLEEDALMTKKFILDTGLCVVSEPFIPEYAGFIQSEKDDAIVYSKEDYFLTQKGGKWICIHEDKVYEFYFNNMFEAVTTLGAIGCYCPVEEYMKSCGPGKERLVQEIREESSKQLQTKTEA